MAWPNQDTLWSPIQHSNSRSIVHGGVWGIPPPLVIPNQFTFVDIIDAVPLTWYWSEPVFIDGINTTANVVCTAAPGIAIQALLNGQLQPLQFVIGTGWRVLPFPISNGEYVQLGTTSLLALGGHLAINMDINGVNDDWDVTTVAFMATIEGALAVTEDDDSYDIQGEVVGSPAVLATFAVTEEDDDFAPYIGYGMLLEGPDDDTLVSFIEGPPAVITGGQPNQTLLPLLKAIFKAGVR